MLWQDKAKKRKQLLSCPQVGFLNFGGSRSEIYFSEHPKVQNLGAFSTFFLKKSKKHPIWTKLGAFLTLFFKILFFEDGQSLKATQHFFFLGLVMMWWLYLDLLVALVADYGTMYLYHLDSYTVTVCYCVYLVIAHVVVVQLPKVPSSHICIGLKVVTTLSQW